MSNETKKVWLIVIGSYVAGMLVTFLLMHFCCCPWMQHKRPEFMPRVAQQQMMMHHKHNGMHHGKAHHGQTFGKRHHKSALGKKHHEPNAEMKARFAEKLGLTEEQKAKLEQYRNEDMAKLEPLFKQMDELRGQLRELREAGRAHFESVLTDEQKEILQTMKKEHHHKGAHGFHEKKGEAETE